jgi:HSP20 family molecular chaperone IbpA
MLAEALEMFQQAERMHRQFFGLGPASGHGPCWEPPVDMIETERELVVLIALPGVAPGKIDLALDGETLYVAGERRMPAPAGSRIRRLEIPYGRFERRIALPAGRYELAGHELANGCLYVALRPSQG